MGFAARFGIASMMISAVSACTKGETYLRIPSGGRYTFCCQDLDGTTAQSGSVTYASVNSDTYDVQPGIASNIDYDHCSEHISTWYTPDKHSGDNYQYTTSGSW